MTQIKWFIVLALFAFAIGICNSIKENKEDKKYFDELNLKVTGVVESVDLTYPGVFGVIKASILESNIDFYDPRKSRQYYYCLIKNKQVEFYQYDLYECAVGDTISVNTRRRSFLIKRGSKEIEKDIGLCHYGEFFDYVRKKHQKF